MKKNESKKRILNVLPMGNIGGIERLCLDVARYSIDDNYFYFLYGGGAMADAIAEITQNIEIRNFSYAKLFKEYRYFYDYIEKNKIDIILVQVPSPIILTYLAMIKRRKKNVKICMYIHANPFDIFKSAIKRYQFKLVQEQVDGCIAVSKLVAFETTKMFGIDNIKVIYNGIDLDRFGNGKPHENTEPIRLIFVGRLIPEKGVDLIIRSLGRISGSFFLEIVGDGPCRKELEELSKVLGLSEKIAFMGFRNDVEILLQKADLFVHPATWKEGFGITIIEAMATGVPCIAYNRGALPEIVTDGCNGFLVENFTEESYRCRLQEVIDLYYQDALAYKSISDRARIRARDFSIQSYTYALSNFLHAL